MTTQRSPSASSRRGAPTKLGVGILVLLIGYALLQPVLNRKLGWHLPALAPSESLRVDPEQSNTHPPKATSPPSVVSADTASESAAIAGPTLPAAGEALPAAGEALRFGLLRQIAPDDFMSPAGLRYTSGSAEGHRLAHLQRHLEDAPDRPGKHGVFEADMPQVIRWLDETYALAKRQAAGSSISEEDGRTVYEASFPAPVGFVGGRDGRRDRYPKCRHIRLVVDGNRVITAFPF